MDAIVTESAGQLKVPWLAGYAEGGQCVDLVDCPMLGFKKFRSAAKIIAGIETMHAIKKGQLGCHQGLVVSDADRF